MNKKILLAIPGLVLTLASSGALATPLSTTNLVDNGSFEAGFSGWTHSADFFASNDYAHSGAYSAQTGCGGSECVIDNDSGAFIAQTLDTAAGASYRLAFWVLENGGPPAALSVFWDGALVAIVRDPAPLGSDFVEYSFDNLLATGAATGFELHGRQDAASIYFDDVSVVQTGGTGPEPVPEPGSLPLLGLGVAGWAMVRRRAGRSTASA